MPFPLRDRVNLIRSLVPEHADILGADMWTFLRGVLDDIEDRETFDEVLDFALILGGKHGSTITSARNLAFAGIEWTPMKVEALEASPRTEWREDLLNTGILYTNPTLPNHWFIRAMEQPEIPGVTVEALLLNPTLTLNEFTRLIQNSARWGIVSSPNHLIDDVVLHPYFCEKHLPWFEEGMAHHRGDGSMLQCTPVTFNRLLSMGLRFPLRYLPYLRNPWWADARVADLAPADVLVNLVTMQAAYDFDVPLEGKPVLMERLSGEIIGSESLLMGFLEAVFAGVFPTSLTAKMKVADLLDALTISIRKPTVERILDRIDLLVRGTSIDWRNSSPARGKARLANEILTYTQRFAPIASMRRDVDRANSLD